MLLVIVIFTGVGIALVVSLILQLSTTYDYLKSSMEWIEYDKNDYTISNLSWASDKLLYYYCYLNGQSTMNSNSSLNSLWSKYLSEISNAWKYQFVIPIILVLLNYFYQFGYWAFIKFYRFSNTRTENLVLWFQIYLSMILFNIMLPLIVFSTQYTELTRGFYPITSPLYSIFFIFTVGLLSIEKFVYWMFMSCNRKIKKMKAVIQKEIKNALRHPSFDITHKVPYLLGLLTITMFYVGGIPIFIFFFFLFIFVYFWI